MEAIKVKGLTGHTIKPEDYFRSIWYLRSRSRATDSPMVERWKWNFFVNNVLEYEGKKHPKILLHLKNEGFVDVNNTWLIVDRDRVESKMREIEEEANRKHFAHDHLADEDVSIDLSEFN